MGMQPPSPAGSPAAQPVPAPGRAYGTMVLLASLGGALFLLILMVVVAAALLWLSGALLLAMTGGQELLPPSVPTVLWAALAVTAAALLLSIALDAVVTVQSLRRMDGTRGDRAVPVINLIAVLLATVLPLLLAGLLAIGFLIPSQTMVSVLTAVLMMLLAAAAPTARIAQFVTGILVLLPGRPDSPSVGSVSALP